MVIGIKATMLISSISVKAVMLFSSVSIVLADVIPQAVTQDPFSSVGKLSLEVCLITAVGVLWRALGAKDTALAEERKLVLQLVEKVTAALERSGLGTTEARADLEYLRSVIEQRINVRDQNREGKV